MNSSLTVLANRTPITGQINAERNKREINAFGCGLLHTIATAPKDIEFNIWVNITTPYMPIISAGKAPTLLPFQPQIREAVSKAVKKAHLPNAKGLSQKAVVLDHLHDVIATVSGDGKYKFNQRQLLYVLRKIVKDTLGVELKRSNFSRIIDDYEAAFGEIQGMYHEPRGSIYHPHLRETLVLGDLMVEKYERPEWYFNKVVYIEKEGFSEALKEANWAERHDCMLTSSKGFTTRAIKDLVDKLAAHDEPCDVYAVHDADAYGTMIYQTFQEATRARGARKIRIIDLGLQPWEAIEMGLEVEDVEVEDKDKRKPVADYVHEREDTAPDGSPWAEWLQTHRIELNAMTTPRFIEWLDSKMTDAEGKLVPPAEVIAAELDKSIEAKLRDDIRERILREAGFEAQVAEAFAAVEKPAPADLVKGVRELFKREPDRAWRDHVEAVANLKNRDGR